MAEADTKSFGEKDLLSLEKSSEGETKTGFDMRAAKRICGRVSMGAPLSVACQEEGVSWAVVNRWLEWGSILREAAAAKEVSTLPSYILNFMQKNPDLAWDLIRFADNHDRARIHFYDFLAEECITLADSVVEYKTTLSQIPNKKSNSEYLKTKDLSAYTNAVKLQISTRQWYIERRASEKYGDVQRIAPKHHLVTPVLNVTAIAGNQTNGQATPTTVTVESIEYKPEPETVIPVPVIEAPVKEPKK